MRLPKIKLKPFLILLIFLLASFSTLYATQNSTSRPPSLASQLGWITKENNYNLCGGYYKGLPIAYKPNPFIKSQSDNYNIEADQTIYSFKGKSTLKGNVKITQPNHKLLSNIAYLYRDKNTTKPISVEAIDNVHLIEPGKLIIAQRGHVDLKTKIITLTKATYRIALDASRVKKTKNPKTGKTENRFYQSNAWGKASKAVQLKHGNMNLYDATYTTCLPNKDEWKLKASKIILNSETGRGQATHTRLLLKGIPVFYTPYFNFPIDKKRHTGFLASSFSSSSDSGISLNLPFYWNIAPNYDATISPKIMTNRGILLDNSFRYLTPLTKGSVALGFIFNDREFKSFQKRSLTKWKDRPSLNRLQNASANRKAFSWRNEIKFNPHLSSKIDYNYVSDDYYTSDFGTNLINKSKNQLLRTLKVSYKNTNWNVLGNFQSYQTLHPVDQADINNQYARLPQIKLNLNYPNSPYGLNYTLQTEAVHFTKKTNPWENIQPTIGNRINLKPTVSLPITRPFAYFTPRLQLQVTKYDVGHTVNNNSRAPGAIIPIFDAKTGLYFDRLTSFFKHDYQQTLEPNLYYLYVPYRDQNRMPIFDTAEQVFNYDLMYQNNRFSGIDRIGDANQITTGIKTRFLDKYTGDEKAELGIGQIHYFKQRKVSLCSENECPISETDRKMRSPIAAHGVYYVNPSWSVNLGAAWNQYNSNFDQQTVGFQYLQDSLHIVNATYTFSKGGDTLAGSPANSAKNDLKQTNISAYWKLTNRWRLLGRWNYNWSHGNNKAYFAGVEYESCCWAVRVIAARTFKGMYPGSNDRYQFDNSFFVQFSLKGLGNIGNKDPSNFLTQEITGYSNNFGKEI